MKLNKIFYVVAVAIAGAWITSCSNWTQPERKVFDNQEHLHRMIPFLEAKTEADLNADQRAHYAAMREYFKKPHVRGFGWFGNWTGKGTDGQNYLKALPDSVDFVSLWGPHGNFSKEQKEDLAFFQKIKGGKALLCWIVASIGDQLTPPGKDQVAYWVTEKGKGDEAEATKAYANAICDSIFKYNLDGFDIDYEPGYGSYGNLANGLKISDKSGDNQKMYLFIKTMYDRLHPAGKMIVMDGQPDLLSTEASKMVDYYIYQAYWESNTARVLRKINKPNLDNWEKKTIITVEFEQGWRTGGVRYYRSVRSEVNKLSGGRQFVDYATFDFPDGKRIAGVGSYHMEYDYKNNPPYKWLRMALYYGNQVIPGKFQ